HQLVSLFLAPFRLGYVGEARVDVDQEAVRVARLQKLSRELVELARPPPVAEVVENPCQDGVAARRVLGMRVRDQSGDLHRQCSRLLAPPEPGKSAGLLEAVLGPLEAVGASLEERPALREEIEGLLSISPAELDVRKQLVGARDSERVLRQAEELKRAACVPCRSLGIVALVVQAGLRPVQLGP